MKSSTSDEIPTDGYIEESLIEDLDKPLDELVPTNLHMLFDKISVTTDVEFAEACSHIGLLSEGPRCTNCSKQVTNLVATEDGAAWVCECSTLIPLRTESWASRLPDVSLRTLVLLIYFWARGYTKETASHEAGADSDVVSRVYSELDLLPTLYLGSQLADLVGEVEAILVKNNLIAAEVQKPSNAFVLPIGKDCNQEAMVSTLMSHIAAGSQVTVDLNLFNRMGNDMATKLISDKYSVDLVVTKEEPKIAFTVWEEFSQQTKTAEEFVFQKRTFAQTDPFLFVLAMIAELCNLNF